MKRVRFAAILVLWVVFGVITAQSVHSHVNVNATVFYAACWVITNGMLMDELARDRARSKQ